VVTFSTSTLKASLSPSSLLYGPRPALAIQEHLAATERLGLDAFSSILVRPGFRASESEFLSIPTLTIVALAIRQADYIADQMAKQNI
jgi:hypothetical protein